MKNIKIRKGVFETNSSSTHAIVVDIDTNIDGNLFKTDNPVEVYGGEFGWEENVIDDFHTKLDYMITMMDNDSEFFNRVQTLLNKEIGVLIQNKIQEDDFIYVDHAEGHIFSEMSDKEILQYLFNDKSRVITCNDNYGASDEMKALESNEEKNENFKIYYKGN